MFQLDSVCRVLCGHFLPGLKDLSVYSWLQTTSQAAKQRQHTHVDLLRSERQDRKQARPKLCIMLFFSPGMEVQFISRINIEQFNINPTLNNKRPPFTYFQPFLYSNFIQ